MAASTWYWANPGGGNPDALASWNSAADGSGSAPTGFGTGATQIGADSTLVFSHGSAAVNALATPTNITTVTNIKLKSGWDGGIANASTGWGVAITGTLTVGSPSTVMHISGAIANVRVDATASNPKALYISNDVSGVLEVNGGNVHVTNSAEITLCVQTSGYISDDEGVDWVDVTVSGPTAVFDSQNTPDKGSGQAVIRVQEGATANLRGIGGDAFILEMSGNCTVNYMADADIYTYTGRGGAFITTLNPHDFSVGSGGAGQAVKYPQNRMILTAPGSTVSFPNDLVMYGAGSTAEGLVTIPGGVSGITL